MEWWGVRGVDGGMVGCEGMHGWGGIRMERRVACLGRMKCTD